MRADPRGPDIRRRWRRRTGPLLLLLLVPAAGAAAYPVLRGWTRAPAPLVQAAVRSVAMARAAGAGTYAPELLARAETSLAGGTAEYTRQLSRWLPFRNFGRVRDALACAVRKGDAARRGAEQGVQASQGEARAALQRASVTLGRAEGCGAALTGSGRGSLGRARLLLAEARSLLESGAFAESRRRSLRSMEAAAAVCGRAAELAGRFLDRESIRTWKGWIDATLRESRTTGKPAILVVKEKNQLILVEGGRAVRTYRADLGANRLRRKLRAGDMATPEGRYHVAAKKGPGESRYFLALLLDYPNPADRQRLREAKQAGRVSSGSGHGGDIEIHGEGGRGEDWTRGCIALANADMREVFDRVEGGTPVTIVGADGEGGAFSALARRAAGGAGTGAP